MTSSGDGVIQTIIPIARGEGGALNLKTADYYLASGRAMEPDGVEPDIAVSPVAEGYDGDEGPLPPPITRPSSRNVIYPEPGRTYDDFQLSIALRELGQG